MNEFVCESCGDRFNGETGWRKAKKWSSRRGALRRYVCDRKVREKVVVLAADIAEYLRFPKRRLYLCGTCKFAVVLTLQLSPHTIGAVLSERHKRRLAERARLDLERKEPRTGLTARPRDYDDDEEEEDLNGDDWRIREQDPDKFVWSP